MKKYVAPVVAGLFFLTFGNQPALSKQKKQPVMTGLQLQQIQAHEFDGDKKTVFASVMSVFQDAGYRIQSADFETGLITGIGSSKGKVTYNFFWGFGKSKKTPIVSAFIEEINKDMTRARLNFVMGKMKSTIYSAQPQDEEPITDPEVYKDAFEKIEQAVFLRQSMAASAPLPDAINSATPETEQIQPIIEPAQDQ